MDNTNKKEETPAKSEFLKPIPKEEWKKTYSKFAREYDNQIYETRTDWKKEFALLTEEEMSSLFKESN